MLLVRLERVRPETNERRYYAVYFERTLFGPAVVRVHGRKDAWSHTLPPVAFPDLETAAPYVHRLVRRRIRRGYRVVFVAPNLAGRG